MRGKLDKPAGEWLRDFLPSMRPALYARETGEYIGCVPSMRPALYARETLSDVAIGLEVLYLQ